MMTRLLTSALAVVVVSQAALAQTAQQNPPSTSAQNAEASQNVPQSLQQSLTSAGFKDVNIVPGSFVVTAKDQSGRPTMMRITPNSMFFLTEIPATTSSTTTGAATERSNSTQNEPSAGTTNTEASQTLPGSLREKLTSAKFSDVNIVPSSFLITARDPSDRPVMMRITPNSMFFVTEVPVVNPSATTGAGQNNANDSGQRR